MGSITAASLPDSYEAAQNEDYQRLQQKLACAIMKWIVLGNSLPKIWRYPVVMGANTKSIQDQVLSFFTTLATTKTVNPDRQDTWTQRGDLL